MNRLRVPLICATVVAAVALIPAADAAASVPSSPAGDRFSAWLEVVQGGDSGAVASHYEEAFDTAFKTQVPLNSYSSLATQVGPSLRGAEIAHVDVKSRYAIDVYMPTGMGWLCVALSVSSVPPHPITGLQVRPAQKPEGLDGDDESSEGASAKPSTDTNSLQALLEQAQKEAGFPGAAAVWMVDGEIVEQAVAGVRAAGSDAAVEIDDRFHIGSLTKSMTGTVVAKLVEQGKLTWEAKIGDLAPELEMNEAYRSVTLRELLAHRAGVPTGLAVDQEQLARWNALEGNATDQREQYLKELLAADPIAEPGSSQNYSNVGYTLAGYLAERASGKAWSDLVRATVFKPLKMKSAGFGWPNDGRDDEPSGHTATESGELRVQQLGEYTLGPFLDPAGDVHCNVLDLARYGNGHLDGLRGGKKLLKPATMKALHTPVADGDYSGGWVHTAARNGEATQWHNGTAGTFYAFLAIMPDSERVFAFVANALPGAEEAAVRIGRALRDRDSEGE